MRKTGQKQSSNKFLKLISMPIRALCRARDLYVRSINGCASRTVYSASAPLPRSRSSSSAVSSSRRSFSGEDGGDDDYSELVRAASVRSMGHRNEVDMFLQEQRRQRRSREAAAAATAARGGLPKSCSVGMAKIEEEEDEGEGSLNQRASDRLYPRSRSYAVSGKPHF